MRKLWIAVGVVAVVLVGGFIAVYLAFFNNDSPPPLTLSTGTTVAGAATTGASSDASSDVSSADPTTPATTAAPVTADSLAGTWTIADGSVAGYRVREKLAQLPAKSDAVGRTHNVTGTMTIAGPPFMVTAADFTVDVTTLASDSDRRDGQIKRRGLETDTYPTATFTLTQPVAIPAEALSGSPVTVQATGDLTIHGVTNSATIPLQTQLNGSQIEVVGSLTFPMSDFGMDPPTIAGIVDVESDATLEFQLFLAQ